MSKGYAGILIASTLAAVLTYLLGVWAFDQMDATKIGATALMYFFIGWFGYIFALVFGALSISLIGNFIFARVRGGSK
jgi:hypothetical protein